MKYDGTNLAEVLAEHSKWLGDYDSGSRASFAGAYLPYAKFQGAILDRADFRGADLYCANLREASLFEADFRGASLVSAHLNNAYLNGSFLNGANLRNADLRGANLCASDMSGVNLRNAKLDGANYVPMACPSDGSFTGWKKCISVDGAPLIVKLIIPKDAKRSSAYGRKCRCSKAKVLDIQTVDGASCCSSTIALSNYDKQFMYVVGATVYPESEFDDDRFTECASGIHFFIDRNEAVKY